MHASQSNVVVHSIQTHNAAGEELSEPIVTPTDLFDGDTYEAYLDRQHYISFTWSGSSASTVESHLYAVSDNGTSTEREYVSEVPIGFANGIPQAVPFTAEPGMYELEIYELQFEEPDLVYQGIFRSIREYILPTVFAQASDEMVLAETITFTVVEASEYDECCSSVVFLPGIKGSVLGKDGLVGNDTLWPPTAGSNDLGQLALNGDGSSTESVYVDGILNDFKGSSVYQPFSNYADELVSTGAIEEWKSLPYDWRLAPETIIADGVQTAEGVVDLIEEIKEVADDSQTGKVTIVGHSMGGIMGKAIIREMESRGLENLFDNFVMVGSPQLGTPQAVASLLHGDGEGIPNYSDLRKVSNDLIVSSKEVRLIAQNMQSSYNLLPSRKYFDTITDPVILFDALSQHTQEWHAKWGYAVSNYESVSEFLTGSGVARSDPAADDLNTPTILSANLLSNADSLHDTQDDYSMPENIDVVQIVGWGLPTVKGVLYTEEHDELTYHPQFTPEGDGVVIYTSADAYDDAETYYFNQQEFKEQTGTDTSHAYLLNAAPIQSALASLISNESIIASDVLVSTKPDTSFFDGMLLVSAHSPVLLGVYDGSGNFTGVKDNEVLEGIDGSTYLIYGESQYIFVPEGGEYTFVYEGTGTGSTTIRIAQFSENTTEELAVYPDIDTTASTTATFVIGDETSPVIEVDIDGDGTVDVLVSATGDVTVPEASEEDEVDTEDETGSEASSGGGGRRSSSAPTPQVAGISTSSSLYLEAKIVQLLTELVALYEELVAMRVQISS
ncbi:MAG: hypothetical protein WDZ93_02130 [Candidatus Paceibacterota bacterium]